MDYSLLPEMKFSGQESARDNDNTVTFTRKELGELANLKMVKLSDSKKQLPIDIKNNRSLQILPFKTAKDKIKQRPLMKENVLFTHPSSVIINGKSGSGKSNLLVNLLSRPEFYGRNDKGKHYFDDIYLFSPTAGCMDDLCKHLVDFSPLTDDHIFNDFDQKKLMDLLDEQKREIDEKGIEKSKKLLILLDDIQADQKFLTSKAILKLFTMNRHYNTSTWLCGQSFTKTPRPCRLQANNIIFFNGSKSELDKIIEEFSPPRLSKRDFEDLINHALEDQYNFLHINMRAHWKERYRKNLDILLEIA